MVYLSILHQAALCRISIHTQQAASTLSNSPHPSKTISEKESKLNPAQKACRAYHNNCLLCVEGWQKSEQK